MNRLISTHLEFNFYIWMQISKVIFIFLFSLTEDLRWTGRFVWVCQHITQSYGNLHGAVSVCACVCVSVCVCVCVCVCTLCAHMFVCTCVCLSCVYSICTCVSVCPYAYMFMHTCIFSCVWVCTVELNET